MSKIGDFLEGLADDYRKNKREEFNSVVSIDFQKEIEKSVEYYNTNMKRIFPNNYVNAKFDNNDYYNTYSVNIKYSFANVEPKYFDATGGSDRLVYANSLKIGSLLFLSSNRGDLLDKFTIETKNHTSYHYTENGLEFNMSSDSVYELTKKYVDWFRKNKELILSIKK